LPNSTTSFHTLDLKHFRRLAALFAVGSGQSVPSPTEGLPNSKYPVNIQTHEPATHGPLRI
jgi:hypothetical protein